MLQVVETREQADVREHADPGKEHEPDMLGTALDDAVKPPQVIPVRPGPVRIVQDIEHRLVVFIHQNDHRLLGASMQMGDQPRETVRPPYIRGSGVQSPLFFDEGQLGGDVMLEIVRFVVFAVETDPYHRMGLFRAPVPMRVDIKSPEQRLVAREQFAQGIEQQTLAEATRAGQEVVIPLIDHLANQGGLVNVVAVTVPDSAEGLDADRQPATGHALVRFHRPNIITREPSEERSLRRQDAVGISYYPPPHFENFSPLSVVCLGTYPAQGETSHCRVRIRAIP